MKNKVLSENTMDENKPKIYNQYVNIFITPYFGPMFGKRIPKKFPSNTDLLYVRAWAGQYFKIKDMSQVDVKFRIHEADCWEKIEDKEMTKSLNYFGMKGGSEIIFDAKEKGDDYEEKKEAVKAKTQGFKPMGEMNKKSEVNVIPM